MRSQNKILAGSSKTTVVLFVIQLFLLFEKLSQVSQVIPLIPCAILARRAVIFSAQRGPTDSGDPLMQFCFFKKNE